MSTIPSSDPQVRDALERGLAELRVQGPEDLQPRLLAYLDLLAKWNRAYNLSAVREPREMVTRHLLDSLAILPWVTGDKLLDIGSGAGLPGIPLAIARPELRVTLLDSNGKKTRFLRQAVLELPLANVEVFEGRVEAFRPERPFDRIASRAFSELGLFLRLARPHLAPGGRLLAMKGRLERNELAQIEGEPVKLLQHRLNVPGLAAERHLLELTLD